MSFEIEIKEQPGKIYLIFLEGSLDSDTYTILDERLAPILGLADLRGLVMNLKGLFYVSSDGLSVIFKARRITEGKGGTFMMTGLQPQIKKVFDILKALPETCVFQDMAEVDAYLDAMQKEELEKDR
ncbi:MAG: STAS domain-containing protein [Candidatus Omnitrophica bacterium]|nr:STAS domain-containing protein [Candidatus Omnitrophota bacterium]MDD5487504.1 STAS domain-containing protein [Candidatus Omnitrophota bacterium]